MHKPIIVSLSEMDSREVLEALTYERIGDFDIVSETKDDLEEVASSIAEFCGGKAEGTTVTVSAEARKAFVRKVIQRDFGNMKTEYENIMNTKVVDKETRKSVSLSMFKFLSSAKKAFTDHITIVGDRSYWGTGTYRSLFDFLSNVMDDDKATVFTITASFEGQYLLERY